ncbi:MAG TPA: acyl-CoA dehydrogenase family protein [Acidimicrobiales bacterium]|jgi:alkylation response protein AidB-like acyl-CoA dehydrogenase
MTVTDDLTAVESLDDFSQRVRQWAEATLDPIGETERLTAHVVALGLDPRDQLSRGRALLRLMDEADLSGLVYPKEYGGQGLTAEYLKAFNTAVSGYDVSGLGPWILTLGMNAPTMLEYGTDEQKRTYLPRMFRGEDLWIQFLSEPTGGSDLASALTRADRDGDEWILNGSKIWTSSADRADWGMCLARTNWDVPKHRGLSVFLVPMRSPGLEIRPLKMISGQTGFCQEFFDDVRLPADALLGELHNGWAVASRLLVHERNVLNGGSEHWVPPAGGFAAAPTATDSRRRDDLVELAARSGQASDPHVRQLVAEAYVNSKVAGQTGPRIVTAMRKGLTPPAASSILKLINSVNGIRRSDITLEISDPSVVAWHPGDADAEARGVGYLSRQTVALVSGTSEIQRNIIGERVLALPRESAPDRELPFSDVRHNTMPTAGR